MTLDFNKMAPVQIGQHVTFQPFEHNAIAATLWRHKPGLGDKGKVQFAVGTVGHPNYPVKDTIGLVRKAVNNGWFAWKPGAEPDMRHYPKNVREFVLKVWKYHTDQEAARTAKKVEVPVAPPAPPPAPIVSILCADCGYEPPVLNRAGLPHPEHMRRAWMAGHRTKQHSGDTQARVAVPVT
jgi:hypothetical protein